MSSYLHHLGEATTHLYVIGQSKLYLYIIVREEVVRWAASQLIMNSRWDSLPKLQVVEGGGKSNSSSNTTLSQAGGLNVVTNAGALDSKTLQLPLRGVQRSSSSGALPPVEIQLGEDVRPRLEHSDGVESSGGGGLLLPVKISSRSTSCPAINKAMATLASPTASICPRPPDTPRTSLKSFNVSAVGGYEDDEGDSLPREDMSILVDVSSAVSRTDPVADSYGKCLRWLKDLPIKCDSPMSEVSGLAPSSLDNMETTNSSADVQLNNQPAPSTRKRHA